MSEKKASVEKKEIIKKRNWAFVIYPESVIENWIEQLQLTGLSIAISPLHNRDVDFTTGEIKKEHYHVIVNYQGPTSYNVIKKITDKFNATNPIPLESIKGYYRYFTHKDNPEKYQYDESHIKTLNGFNVRNFIDYTRTETLEIIKNIHTYIRNNNILEYCDLLDMLYEDNLFDEYEIAINKTILFCNYIKSRKFKIKEIEQENKLYSKSLL